MKIRWRRRDISQARHAQNFRLRRRQRMENSMSLEKIAADIYALVAGDAPQGFEQPISVQFFRRQRGCISCQPTIEPAARCYQRSLKAYDGVYDVRGVRAIAVRSSEFPAHVGIRVELFHQLGKAAAHDLRALQCCFEIRLERTDFPFPTKAEAERGIEYGKGIERKVCAVEANIMALRACAICAEIVARQTTA